MTLELHDIQGIVFEGYGKLAAASFVLLAIDDAEGARRWLGELELRTAATSGSGPAINVALTHAGLEALELDERILTTLPVEVREGMATEFRQRVLGDVEESDPASWIWGGPKNPAVHVLLMLYAHDDAELEALVAKCTAEWEERGLRRLDTLPTRRLPKFKEHFGFRDGVAEVPVRGYKDQKTGIAPGEFVLGYANEYGKYTASPTVPEALDPEGVLPVLQGGGRDLGRNGSYLVFRQLAQDVRGFWKWVDDAAGGNADERVRLASKMVGRWPGGAPLVRHPDTEPVVRAHAKPDNAFLYMEEDPHGHRCPLGSHIRRTNPRDALGSGSDDPIGLSNKHRIIRRGRAYGEPVAADMTPGGMLAAPGDGVDRGLHFLCFNANIERQFEFVQQTWANNPKFASLRNDPDPMVGARYQPNSQFTVQSPGVRQRLVGMPSFVTTRGGAYFFLPGIRAVKYLAQGAGE